ncbi:MAG: arylesterase [Thermoanaerobaculia bacterium]
MQPRSRTPLPPAKPDRRLLYAAGATLLVVLAAWALWPSRGEVANLGSRGTSVVAFGDSLTAGVGASAESSWPSRVAADLAIPIVNAGVSGDTSQGALARLDDDVLTSDPRIVIVGLGGNDFLQNVPLATTEANLREIVRRIEDAGAMVVLLGFRFPSLKARYDEMYERIAEEEKCLLVDDVLDGILSDPALRSDPIHPNARGYAVMAERIAESLEDLIRDADRAR